MESRLTLNAQLKRNPKDRTVEIRKLSKQCYIPFIKSSQKFYRQYILHLDAQADGIPDLRKIAQKLNKGDGACGPVTVAALC